MLFHRTIRWNETGFSYRSGFHTTTQEPKRAQLRVPAFKNTTKIAREDPEREEKNEFCGGRGKKERNFGRSRGRAVLGWAVRGRVVRRKIGPGEGRSGSRGTKHDQTKTLKPTPTRETPLHETVKQRTHKRTTHNAHTNTPHTNTPHTQHTTHTTSQTRFWPKVGHTTKH